MTIRPTAMALAAILLLVGCSENSVPAFQGWVEADLIFVGADEAGRVETLAVREGDHVAEHDPLFTLDADLQQADVAMQEASLKNAQQAYDRATALVKTNAGTRKALDDAEAALRTAQARLNSAQTRLARRKVASPAAGPIEQVYFRVGEMVPAGKAIVAILPPGNIKVRFFVNEAMLPNVKLGDTVNVSCDGCVSGLTAKVSFISRSAEFTPPVIYSREERSKLVFLIEALPSRPDALRVGQPVTVTFASASDATSNGGSP
jgi:HlyD family secretion protein